MDSKLIFGIIGFFAGLATGAGVTYVIARKKSEDLEDDLMDEADFWQEKYRELKDHISSDDSEDEEKEEVDRLTPDVPVLDERIDNNKGVKKYHTQVDSKGLENKYKEALGKVTEGEKALKREDELKAAGKKDDTKVYEITEDQYISDPDYQSYEKVTLDYYIEDDTLVMIDPEEIAEQYYKCGREELIGKVWRWAPDYIREGNTDGVVYVRNDSMNIDFEVIVHNASYKELMGDID